MIFNYIIYLFIYIILAFIAGVVGVVLVFIEEDPAELIIKYQNKTKNFKSINQIKKDVGAAAFDSVIQFEHDPEKIIKMLYPNCKIIKNTLL